jgi:hypothetical protein
MNLVTGHPEAADFFGCGAAMGPPRFTAARPDAWRARFQRVPPPLTLGLGNDPVMGFNRRRMEAERKAKADAEQKAKADAAHSAAASPSAQEGQGKWANTLEGRHSAVANPSRLTVTIPRHSRRQGCLQYLEAVRGVIERVFRSPVSFGRGWHALRLASPPLRIQPCPLLR